MANRNMKRWPRILDWILISITVFILIFVTLLNDVSASERDYQVEWCGRFSGEIEFVLPDRTRVDCVLPDYAIEFDFGKKWAESIGQSIFYASQLNKRPGIVLIIQSVRDCKYLDRLRETVATGGLGITIWQVGDYAYLCEP